MLKTMLERVIKGEDLSVDQMEDALQLMTQKSTSPLQIAALLTALRMKGETVSELVGGARMLRKAATFIDCGQHNVVDIVGTGGDGSNTFNISTTSAFVAAGAGVTIAKHGNRAASSQCGSADVLEALGYNLQAPASLIEYAIKEYNIGFLFAQKMHPILANVASIRKELKIRTLFNMLGPLCNPAGAKSMVLGVYAPELTELFASALLELGVKRAMVVHGMEGLDEISCCAPTRVSEIRNGDIRTYELLPELLINDVYAPQDLAGGLPAENARILLDILDNRLEGAKKCAVLLNAGAVIYVSGIAKDLKEGIALAEKSIQTGAAREKLECLKEVSHGKSA